MEFLKEILGEELYKQAKEKLDAYNGNEDNKDKQIKIGNLASGDYISKLKYDDLQTILNTKETELTNANTLIGDLKRAAKGDESLQTKLSEYETETTRLREQLKETQLESAVKVALLGAKASDIDYLTYKLKESGELELDDKGNVKGIDEKIEGLKTKFPNQFESAGGAGGIEPNPLPGGDDRGVEPKNLAEALAMQFSEN